MRLRLLFLAPAFAVAACGGGGGGSGEDTPTVEAVTPDFGPLGGGKRVIINGTGFLNAGAPPNRVLIGGREAPQAGVVDDETLEVIIPEADSPGEVDVVVFNSNGLAMAAGAFRYSDPPAIDSVSPAEVRFDQSATLTVTGSGFADEDAGVTTVLVDGDEAIDVEVNGDGELTFTVPPGLIGNRPDVQVVNGRGDTLEADAYRYVDSGSGALLLTAHRDDFPNVWAVVVDIGTATTQLIPRRTRGGGGSSVGYRSVVRVAGEMHGQFRDDSWHHIDFESQLVTTGGGGSTARLQSMAPIGNTVYAMDRNTAAFGTVNVTNGVFTSIATGIGCPCGLAANGAGTMFLFNSGDQITTINVSTGAMGAQVALAGGFRHVSGMRFVGPTLFASTRDGEILNINPVTGAVTTFAVVPIGISDIEAFE